MAELIKLSPSGLIVARPGGSVTDPQTSLNLHRDGRFVKTVTTGVVFGSFTKGNYTRHPVHNYPIYQSPNTTYVESLFPFDLGYRPVVEFDYVQSSSQPAANQYLVYALVDTDRVNFAVINGANYNTNLTFRYTAINVDMENI